MTPIHHSAVPLNAEAFDAIMEIIPQMLNDDEAGPAFYIIDAQWAKDHNYEEQET